MNFLTLIRTKTQIIDVKTFASHFHTKNKKFFLCEKVFFPNVRVFVRFWLMISFVCDFDIALFTNFFLCKKIFFFNVGKT